MRSEPHTICVYTHTHTNTYMREQTVSFEGDKQGILKICPGAVVTRNQAGYRGWMEHGSDSVRAVSVLSIPQEAQWKETTAFLKYGRDLAGLQGIGQDEEKKKKGQRDGKPYCLYLAKRKVPPVLHS